ncbi:MAG: ribulose-phosphate 3-epimerase [Planctomycetes bacterium]|nr:ribulose-phosphate 3-epimerase [Planctomycetota bacterium]
MIKLCPSLLSCDFAHMADDVAAVEAAGADWLHVDVMDGHFVPNLTIGTVVVKSLKKVATIPLDVHVMIEEPLRFADPFIEAGANIYVFHVEAYDDPAEVIEHVKSKGVRAGITLNPPTPLKAIVPYLDQVDLVMIMSVNPGFGGQGFVPESLDRVRALRQTYGFKGDIEIDGGIKKDNIHEVAACGANIFVSGSGIFQSGDIAGTMAEMRQKAEAAFPTMGT